MFHVRLADVDFEIDNQYNYIQAMCNDYCTMEEADVFIRVTDAEIDAENDGTCDDRAYLESLAIYRKIAEEILRFDGFLLHGAVISVHGFGIAFLARSGVGKSTHISLWQQALPGKVTVINGDKPLLRVIDGNVYAYGTPWAGKEQWQTNSRVLLGKICFLERAEENSCVSLEKETVLRMLLPQVYKPRSGRNIAATMELLDTVIKKTDFYKVLCNKDISAAHTAARVLLEHEIEKKLRLEGVYTTKTEGDSMYPMLKSGDKVIVTAVKKPLKKYDVVVYRRDDHYTMHRIVKVLKNGYLICGDNRAYLEKDIKDADIIGILFGFYKGNTFYEASGKEALAYGKKATRRYWLRKIKERVRAVLKRLK